ncbi:hypothetical protein LSTR_LSTR001957 [Laodelphax striatellus]|uniref:BTB domain-containing protein n=1 Tax=Laodelphax striatellus TaxID=195883 RepID=A0A482XGI9_LAOST|nr:hypothetical protein LSTR_LSTR001957 [Laodelphax striatellus]
MARLEKRRLCKFVSEWRFNNDFSSWLRPVDEDKHKAYCLLCEKVFPVSHGGLNDVKAHGKGKRHNFLKEQQENRARETSVELSSPTQGIFQFVNPKNRSRVLENNANVVVKEDNVSAQKGITIRREAAEDDLTLDSAISESDCYSQSEMTSAAGKMETPQQYCLRWKYHHSNLQVMFSQLLERESFCDVTLACEGKTLRAHKMMLSACSTYFEKEMLQHEENNPIVILKDVKFADIKALVEFMYKGEINVQNSHLSSLLKTAEELRIKGLAEVSWRSEGEGWRSVQEEEQRRGGAGGGRRGAAPEDGDSDSEPPPPKKTKLPPPHSLLLPQPVEHFAALKQQQAASEQFHPHVTSVLGNVLHSSRNDYNDNGTDDSASESQGWEPPAQSDIYNTGDSDNASSTPRSNQPVISSSFNVQSAEEERNASFTQQPQTQQEQSTHLPDLSQYSDVVKMNEYLTQGGRRPQFWEEPFTKRVMEAIKNKELEMKVAAELMGVSYGTLYGRYRDAYGCLKHPYRYEEKRVREAWRMQGPAEVLSKLQRKELTLFRAAEMLNVTVTTLANYLSTLRQGEPDDDGDADSDAADADSDASDRRLASARHVLSNNPDITIVKREPPAAAASLNGSK